MNYSLYGLTLLCSTNIVGIIILFLILFLMNPMSFWLITAVPYMLVINLLSLTITIICVAKLKLERKNASFGAFIYAFFSMLIYAGVIAWRFSQLNRPMGDFITNFIFAIGVSAFLSALLAGSSLPQLEEPPENSADN